jgi:hypothetical protein
LFSRAREAFSGLLGAPKGFVYALILLPFVLSLTYVWLFGTNVAWGISYPSFRCSPG